jgi:membrane protein DedA with SNARE-associated domain
MHIHFAHLLAHYGYLALFVGCLLEGETLLFLAGYAAHRGYLSLPLVVLIAFVAGTLGDQMFFFLGRYYGMRAIRLIPNAEARVAKLNHMLLRYHRRLIVGVRFMYGLRVLGPIVIGSNSEIPIKRFIMFNMLGAALWALLFASVGDLLGKTMSWLIADIRQYEALAVLLCAVVLLIISALHKYFQAPN